MSPGHGTEPHSPTARRWGAVAVIVSLLVVALVGVALSRGRGGSESPDAGPDATPRPSEPAPSTATGRFTLAGSTILDPAGKPFFPVGANVGLAGSFDWRGSAAGHVAQAEVWGWNTVRLNVTCTNTADWSVRYKDGPAAVLKGVDDVIREYTAKKIVVMVACHDPYAQIYAGARKAQVRALKTSTQGAKVDVGKTYQQQIEGFWTTMAQRYQKNTYVWFNFWNEPFGTDNADFVAMNTHFYNLVRKHGAGNIAVADLMNSGNDAAADGAKHVYDPAMGPALAKGKCNLLFSLHAYGWNNNAASYQRLFEQMKQEQLPLVVGEVGYKLSDAPDTLQHAATDAVFDLAPKYGVGVIAWHGTFGDDFSLKKSGNAFYADGSPQANLSPLGTDLWKLGHAKPSVPAPQTPEPAAACGSPAAG